MKLILSVALLAAIQVINGKKWWKTKPKFEFKNPQNNFAIIDQNAISNANSVAVFAGLCGDANANSVAVANNNNDLFQQNL